MVVLGKRWWGLWGRCLRDNGAGIYGFMVKVAKGWWRRFEGSMVKVGKER